MKSVVVGTGKISEEHLKFLQATSRTELAGVCDLSSAAANYAASRFAAEAAYTDLSNMLDKARPDVVHLLTPAHTHAPLVTTCLEHGCHVICEKPVALHHDEFQRLRAIAEKQNRYIIEDHNYRFNEPILAIESLVDQGTLGEVRDVEVRMALDITSGGRYADANLPHPSHHLPCGVIHEFVTHLCYLTLRFIPAVERVAAAWDNYSGSDMFKYDDLDALITGQGIHGRIRFSAHTKPDTFTVIVRGSRGSAETDLFQPYLRLLVPRTGGAQLSPIVNQLAGGLELLGAGLVNFKRKLFQQTPYEGLNHFLTITYEALTSGTPPPVTYDDMDRTSRLVDALILQANHL